MFKSSTLTTTPQGLSTPAITGVKNSDYYLLILSFHSLRVFLTSFTGWFFTGGEWQQVFSGPQDSSEYSNQS